MSDAFEIPDPRSSPALRGVRALGILGGALVAGSMATPTCAGAPGASACGDVEAPPV